MTKKIDLAIYVHEFMEEVGHSRAMIECVRHFPKDQIRSISIFCYTYTNPKQLFPDLDCEFKVYQCSNIFLKPFLTKMLAFYIFSYVRSFSLAKNCKKIGIGIASINAEYINIQFIHKEWDKLYFSNIEMSIFKKIYKKVLFSTFNFFENFLYSKKNIVFSVLSKFETNFLQKNFNVDTNRMITNYSGINFEKFSLKDENRSSTLERIEKDYKEMEKYDTNKTTYLFIGALERKGVTHAIKEFLKINDGQLIIIGRPEGSSKIEIPNKSNIIYIPHTNQIIDFYQLSDVFIFPTIYEPFGLVILEAAVMGLDVYTSRKRVGASELIENIRGIHLFDNAEEITLKRSVGQKSFTQKNTQRLKVIEVMSDYTWERNSKLFWDLLTLKH